MTRDSSATRATFLGRFQPYHEGHHRVVEWAREEYDFVLALGSPQQDRTPENPLTATERETLIRACEPDLELVRVPDENRGEAGYPVWAERLVDRTDADVVLSRNDLVQRLVREHTTARIEEQPEFDPERFSGTEVRRRIRAGEPWRELVPDCCEDELAELTDVIRRTGADAGDGDGGGGGRGRR